MVLRFLKIPVDLSSINYKLRRLYVIYLQMKAQTVEGVCKIKDRGTKSSYYRDSKKLIAAGWARPCGTTEKGHIALFAYQFVWASMGIRKFRMKSRRGKFGFVYYKLPIEHSDRTMFITEISEIIMHDIAERKVAQIRRSLNEKGVNASEVNFGGVRTAFLFGYRSIGSGSKIRKRYFRVIEAPSKPYLIRITVDLKSHVRRYVFRPDTTELDPTNPTRRNRFYGMESRFYLNIVATR